MHKVFVITAVTQETLFQAVACTYYVLDKDGAVTVGCIKGWHYLLQYLLGVFVLWATFKNQLP